jgi:hypothetical protein
MLIPLGERTSTGRWTIWWGTTRHNDGGAVKAAQIVNDLK